MYEKLTEEELKEIQSKKWQKKINKTIKGMVGKMHIPTDVIIKNNITSIKVKVDWSIHKILFYKYFLNNNYEDMCSFLNEYGYNYDDVLHFFEMEAVKGYIIYKTYVDYCDFLNVKENNSSTVLFFSDYVKEKFRNIKDNLDNACTIEIGYIDPETKDTVDKMLIPEYNKFLVEESKESRYKSIIDLLNFENFIQSDKVK